MNPGKAIPSEWGTAKVTPEILRDIKAALKDAFGERLERVVLFGSAARGDDTPESDIDLMLVLKSMTSRARDLMQAIHASYPVTFAIGRHMSIHPVAEDWYLHADVPLLWNVRREGITL
jgi:predicted nucleotidyltransferase